MIALLASSVASPRLAAQDSPRGTTDDEPIVAEVAEPTTEPLTQTAKPAKNVDLREIVEDPAALSIIEPSTTEIGGLNDSSEKSTAMVPPSTTTTAPDPLPQSTDHAISTVTDASIDDTATVDLEGPVAPLKRQLILLGSEVLPGTTTRLAWSPSVSFLGISAPTSVLVVNGTKPGPRMCLTAALHGDEINGIETVRRVLYNIDADTLAGTIIGVPIVNLQGFRAGSRYLADRRDLNRFFPGNPNGSAASRIAFSFFTEIISQCDMLIDLHTGSFRRTNLPQLRADLSYPAIQELAETMGRIVVLQSKGAKGSLRRAASEVGIPTVTLEAGAPNELNENAVDDSVGSVRAALNGLGLIGNPKSRRRSDAPVYYQSTWVRASEGGILISEAKLGARVKPGDVLGAVTNPITNQRSEIISPTNGRVIGMALNQVMHPGFAAYHLGIDPTAEPVNNPSSILDSQDRLLLESTDDEDPDSDQHMPISAGTALPKNDTGLMTNELIEDGEAGR